MTFVREANGRGVFRPSIPTLVPGKGGGADYVAAAFAVGGNGWCYRFRDPSKLFQDAAGTTPVTASSQKIGRVKDSSPRGNDATQGTSGARPEYQGADGAYSSGLEHLLSALNITGPAGTLLVRAEQTGDGSVARIVAGVSAADGSVPLYAATTSTTRRPFARAGNTGIGGGAGDATQWTVWGIRFNGETEALILDGDAGWQTLLQSGAPISTSPMAILALNRGGSSITNPFIGNLTDAFWIDRALTDVEIENITKQMGGDAAYIPIGWKLTAIGDSFTAAVISGIVTADQAYTALLNDRIGHISSGVNLGQHGDTTGLMYGRRTTMVSGGIPQIAIIYGGYNDPNYATTVAASPTPTDTVFTVSSNAAFYKAGTQIFVGGVPATILSVVGSVVTLTAALAGGAPAAGAAVTFDTQKNLEAIVAYLKSQAVERIAIAGMHYANFAGAGGDTTAVQNAVLEALRGKQATAAAASGAVFVDLYAWMRQLILSGSVAQGDDLAWHNAVGDPHLNVAGQSILADAFQSAMRAAGWVK